MTTHGIFIVATAIALSATALACSSEVDLADSSRTDEPIMASPEPSVAGEVTASAATTATTGVQSWELSSDADALTVTAHGQLDAIAKLVVVRDTEADNELIVTFTWPEVARLALDRNGAITGAASPATRDLLTALQLDLLAEHGSKANIVSNDPEGLQETLKYNCGTGYGPCTTRAAYSCAAGYPDSWPRLCITSSWLFSYPYANGCTGETGVGFCFW